jgi:DNA-binding MarR family transcriptional regulator
MGGTLTIKKKLPGNPEIENVAEQIRLRKYIYISAFSHAVNRYMNIVSRKSMANRTGIAVLTQLIVKGGILHPTELARLMWISKHSMTKVIDSLEKDGFVVRQRIDEDRRGVLIKITSYGLDFILEIMDKYDALWTDVIDTLNEKEQKELMKLLQKMINAFPRDVINMHLS